MSTTPTSYLWAILLLTPFIAADKQCYAPDGTVADSRFLPCIGFDYVDSMCCRVNDTYPDVCSPNGLCYWPHANKYHRDYRTDKTFESPNCVSKTICDGTVNLFLTLFYEPRKAARFRIILTYQTPEWRNRQ